MLEPVENVIKKGIENRVFTGASVAVWSASKNINFLKGYGATESELNKHPVTTQTFFDLASLTKPLVTTLCIMKLVEDKKVSLATPICNFFDLKTDNKITIKCLLSHSSGLPAHFKFYEECQKDCTNYVLEKILAIEIDSKVKISFVYSDLGYILLGEIIKKITGLGLEKYWFKKIVLPLKLDRHFKFTENNKLTSKECCLTKNLVNPEVIHCGSVHDDNCRIMGGVAGHAGLFGNLEGVYALVKLIFNLACNESNVLFLKGDLLTEFFNKKKNSTWLCGFDTPSALYSSSGRYFSEKSLGHLGFTVTSFWIDLEKEILIILLTNRAYYPDSLMKMKKFRPYFHDVIMEMLT